MRINEILHRSLPEVSFLKRSSCPEGAENENRPRAQTDLLLFLNVWNKRQQRWSFLFFFWFFLLKSQHWSSRLFSVNLVSLCSSSSHLSVPFSGFYAFHRAEPVQFLFGSNKIHKVIQSQLTPWGQSASFRWQKSLLDLRIVEPSLIYDRDQQKKWMNNKTKACLEYLKLSKYVQIENAGLKAAGIRHTVKEWAQIHEVEL